MQTIGEFLVSVTGIWQTSRTWVVRGWDGQGTYSWDVSQQFIRGSKDRRLGIEPNSFSDGQRTDAGDSSRLGLEPNSFSLCQRIDTYDLNQIGLEPNSFAVGWRTDIWDSSRLRLESIDIFGHILCKELPCLTILGTPELWEKTKGKKGVYLLFFGACQARSSSLFNYPIIQPLLVYKYLTNDDQLNESNLLFIPKLNLPDTIL